MDVKIDTLLPRIRRSELLIQQLKALGAVSRRGDKPGEYVVIPVDDDARVRVMELLGSFSVDVTPVRNGRGLFVRGIALESAPAPTDTADGSPGVGAIMERASAKLEQADKLLSQGLGLLDDARMLLGAHASDFRCQEAKRTLEDEAIPSIVKAIGSPKGGAGQIGEARARLATPERKGRVAESKALRAQVKNLIG